MGKSSGGKEKEKKRAGASPEQVIKSRRRRLRDLRILSSAIQKLVVLVVVLFVIFGFLFGIAPMKGSDMEPQIKPGDILIYYRLEKEPARNDVVIMKRDGKQYVGRLIGMPGDTLIIKKDGSININGSNVYDAGIFYETKPYKGGVRYPVALEEGQYFVLADKRDTAKDSRYFGPVSKDEIKGKVVTMIRRVSL